MTRSAAPRCSQTSLSSDRRGAATSSGSADRSSANPPAGASPGRSQSAKRPSTAPSRNGTRQPHDAIDGASTVLVRAAPSSVAAGGPRGIATYIPAPPRPGGGGGAPGGGEGGGEPISPPCAS